MSEPRTDSNLLLDGNFDDLDALSDAVHGWGLELLQLERGPFRARVRQWHDGSLFLTRARFDRKLAQRGASPVRALTLGVPARRDFKVRRRGQEASSRDVMVLPDDGDLDAVSTSIFEIFTISIPEPEWSHVDEETGGLVGALVARHGRLCRCSAESMALLRRSLRRSEAMSLRRGAGDAAIPMLALAALQTSATRIGDGLRGTDRRRALRIATRFIDAHFRRPIRMTELCHSTGMSERTLQYAFRAEYGMTPIQFVRMRRLHRVRRELLRARQSIGAVDQVARASGFRHGGQLAADYRDLFGELPSETLLRRSGAKPDAG